jgi:cytochrome c
MKYKIFASALLAVSAVAFVSSPAVAAGVNAEAAQKLAKKNDCFKCHAIDKTKKGPSYKKIAAKYAGKTAEGEEKMYKNLTTNPMVKLEDGTEEEHKALKAKDEEIKNVIQWILSLK